MSLAGQNLNALVALEALLTERSVGRAAERMGVTQSAMSHTLRQLRERLDDPLLVRVGNGMVPTPFADALMPRLQQGLGELDAILSGRAVFEAEKVEHQFTLAAHDPVTAEILAPLFARLAERAPRASLRFVPIDAATLNDDLSRGRCDAAIVPPFLPLANVRTWATAPAGACVVYREGHPAFAEGMTLDAYCAAPHLMMSLDATGEGPSMVDRLLAKHDRKRRVVVRVPSLLAAPGVLASSDLVATVPDPVMQYLCARWPLASAPPPFPFPQGHLLLAWHERFDADPAQRFFREQVIAVFQALDQIHGRPNEVS